MRDGKISLKFHESIQKKFFFKASKEGNSSHCIIDFKNLSGSEHLSGLNDLNRPDKINGLNNLNSLFGL